jgi:formylglycine-generating enzyme required for sulfatase activity
LSYKTGKNYRLPSEAEWEYAARAGNSGKWSFGNDVSQLGAYAWFSANSDHKSHPVGQKKPNAFGLHDMHGNAREWVEDVWHANYNGAPSDGSAWTSGGDQARRVLRGGAWGGGPEILRSAIRNLEAPGDRINGTGMRIARTN